MLAIRLSNSSQVKRLVNRTINQLLNSEIETDKARCIGCLASVLLKALEVEELETRMTEVENSIAQSCR